MFTRKHRLKPPKEVFHSCASYWSGESPALAALRATRSRRMRSAFLNLKASNMNRRIQHMTIIQYNSTHIYMYDYYIFCILSMNI